MTATRRTLIRVGVSLAMIAAFAGSAGSSAAETPKPPDRGTAVAQATLTTAPGEDPRVVHGFADRTPSEATLTDVRQAVETEGRVRVVVGIATDWAPEGMLSTADAVAQQFEIADLQDTLLAAVPTASVLRRYEAIPFVALDLDGSQLDALLETGLVGSLEIDSLAAPTLRESIPIVGSDVLDASGVDGRNTTVAILDTGIESAHPFMAGGVIYERCFADADGFSNTTAGDCPNGLNYQDTAGAGEPCTWDGCYHGTHVAGIAAGLNGDPGDGGSLLQGVANGAWFASYQVFHQEFFSCESWESVPCARTWQTDYIAALEDMYVNRGIFSSDLRPLAAANMSLGGGQFFSHCDVERASVKAAIDLLRSVGIATVISSGNSGFTDSMGAPGCISTAISVGSTTDSDSVSDFSNVAGFLDVFAPGSSIQSSFPASFGSWDTISGTSMAAPHVTGAVAILKQVDPGASVDDVLAWLEQAGEWVTDTRSGGTEIRPRIWLDPCLADNPECFDKPANDNFFVAYDLANVNCDASNPCYSYLATEQTDEPDHAGNAGGNSVWFKWQAPSDGTVTITTAGSTFDTLLAVYKGGSLSNLTEIASNDDDPAGGVLTSAVVDVSVKNNVWYRIAVDGYSPVVTAAGPAGRVIIDVDFTPAPNLCNGFAATYVGTSAGETITGTSSRDVILARGGNDIIDTMGGNDQICAGAGNDVINSGNGNDVVFGGAGSDDIVGGGGDDELRGQNGNDVIRGRGGDDLIYGGGGFDELFGNTDDDEIRGGDLADVINGGTGDDILHGQKGADIVRGGNGADKIWGEKFDDELYGQKGNDDLFGGPGNDDLRGGPGNDDCDGGPGADTLSSC